MKDQSLRFHESINGLLDDFRNIVASMNWLKISIDSAMAYFDDRWEYIMEMPCSVLSNASIKIDKTILALIRKEGINCSVPLYSNSMINFYRIFTIAVKDILWNEPELKNFIKTPEMQFLRHFRNASAHNNTFFWGEGASRCIPKTIQWRNKIINPEIEGQKLFMDFVKPGDIFILLSDISNFIKK